MLHQIFKILVVFSVCHPSYGALSDLTESELSGVTGEGVALVLESFQLEMLAEDLNARSDGGAGTLAGGDTGNDFKITGVESSAGDAVNLAIKQFYFAGTDTNLGSNLDGKLATIGRLNNPVKIDLLGGDDLGGGSMAGRGILAITLPTQVDGAVGHHCTALSSVAGTGTCSSRPPNVGGNGYRGERFDLGLRINHQTVNPSDDLNLNVHLVSANMDGSYVYLWGSNDSDASREINMEIQLNVYANKLTINSCDLDGSNCGEEIGFKGFHLELALGDAAFYQPLRLEVTNSGIIQLEIEKLPSPGDSRIPAGTIGADGLIGSSTAQTWNWYNDYYTNGRKSNIYIRKLTMGGSDLGSTYVNGLQIQYLKVKTHEL